MSAGRSARRGLAALLGSCSALAAATAPAQDATPAITLPAVTVTATRVAAEPFNVPASVDRVALDAPALGVSLGDALQGVAGVVARERQNYAQDTQISIRGFGSRAAFGIRGVRLILDGIPATQPDGQGQVSHFNLATADRVEVLRGPFSALYGNSSGGVIQAFTAEAPIQPTLSLDAFAGRYGDQRLSLGAAGHGAVLGYTDFRTEGYREHSAARRKSANGKWVTALGAGQLTLIANQLEAPDAQDPLGLTRSQFERAPRQVATVAIDFDTRKSVSQTQAGAIYEQDLGAAGALRVLGYGGVRDVEQFLAIPIAAQTSATAAGGVVDLATGYGGGDARWVQRGERLTWVLGVSVDTLRQHRRGFENFANGQTGVRGRLRRDEINTVTAIDEYLQLDLTLTPRTGLLLGLRHSELAFKSRDRYFASGNGDDSGRVSFSATTPVAALSFRQRPWLHWHAAYGTGFETPTFVELAYRPDGAAGLNLALDPAQSRNAELGVKLKLADRTRIEAALFRADVRDELVTATNRGGRATFANAAQTRRQGAELTLHSALTSQLDLALAYTLLEASVRERYVVCSAAPCATANVAVEAGKRLPGVAAGQWFSRLAYAFAPDWQLAGEFRYLDAVPVNDSNSESAPSYGVFDAALAHRLRWRDTQSARLSLKVENLFDQQYAGSVIVNEGNGRYYEPARGLSVLAGVELQLTR